MNHLSSSKGNFPRRNKRTTNQNHVHNAVRRPSQCHQNDNVPLSLYISPLAEYTTSMWGASSLRDTMAPDKDRTPRGFWCLLCSFTKYCRRPASKSSTKYLNRETTARDFSPVRSPSRTSRSTLRVRPNQKQHRSTQATKSETRTPLRTQEPHTYDSTNCESRRDPGTHRVLGKPLALYSPKVRTSADGRGRPAPNCHPHQAAKTCDLSLYGCIIACNHFHGACVTWGSLSL